MRTVNIKANPGSRTLLFSAGFNHLQILQNNRLETRPWGFVETRTFSLHCLSMQAMQAEPTGSPGGSQIAFPLETHTVFPVFFFFFFNSPRSCNLLQKANIWILMVKRMSSPHQNKELESVINIPLFWTPTSKLWSELSSSSHPHLFHYFLESVCYDAYEKFIHQNILFKIISWSTGVLEGPDFKVKEMYRTTTK